MAAHQPTIQPITATTAITINRFADIIPSTLGAPRALLLLLVGGGLLPIVARVTEIGQVRAAAAKAAVLPQCYRAISLAGPACSH